LLGVQPDRNALALIVVGMPMTSGAEYTVDDDVGWSMITDCRGEPWLGDTCCTEPTGCDDATP
jgi:hypothetical protein